MSYQKYYVPDQSKYPIFMAFALFLLVMGASSTINSLDDPNSNAVYVLYSGLAVLATTLFFWFRNVTKEHIAGLDSAQLQKSFVFGMGWFTCFRCIANPRILRSICTLRINTKFRDLRLNIFYAHRLPWFPCDDGWLYVSSDAL